MADPSAPSVHTSGYQESSGAGGSGGGGRIRAVWSVERITEGLVEEGGGECGGQGSR